jgi:hypothetical protein
VDDAAPIIIITIREEGEREEGKKRSERKKNTQPVSSNKKGGVSK